MIKCTGCKVHGLSGKKLKSHYSPGDDPPMHRVCFTEHRLIETKKNTEIAYTAINASNAVLLNVSTASRPWLIRPLLCYMILQKTALMTTGSPWKQDARNARPISPEDAVNLGKL